MDLIQERLSQGYTFTISTGSFRQDIFVVYGEYKKGNTLWDQTIESCKEEYRPRMKKLLKTAKEVIPFRGVYLSDAPLRVIWIQPTDDFSAFMGTLTHEVGHAVIDVLRYVGIPLVEASEEVYTYLIGDIIENLTWNIFEKEGTPIEEVLENKGEAK